MTKRDAQKLADALRAIGGPLLSTEKRTLAEAAEMLDALHDTILDIVRITKETRERLEAHATHYPLGPLAIIEGLGKHYTAEEER